MTALASSLEHRCLAEAGFHLSRDRLTVCETPSSMPITSYNAKGKRRYVLVIALQAWADDAFSPTSNDASVSEARWTWVDDALCQMAPANAVILAAAMGYSVQVSTPDDLKTGVGCAQRYCKAMTRRWTRLRQRSALQ
jgi:hypothetical protein